MINPFRHKLMSIASAMLITLSTTTFLFCQSTPDSLQAAQQLSIAKNLAQEKQYKDATNHALEAGQLFKQIGLWDNYVDAYQCIFLNGYFSNDYASARILLEKGIVNIPQEHAIAIAKMNSYLGYVYERIGNVFDSIEAYEQTIPAFKLAKDSIRLNKIYGNIAAAYIQIGDYTKAIDYLTAAISSGQHLPDQNTLWKNLKLQGTAYLHQEKLILAEENFKKAQEIKDRKDGTFEHFQAQLYLEKKQFQKANQFVQKALQLSKTNDGKISDRHIRAQHLQGNIHLSAGQADEALQLFSSLLPHYQEGVNNRSLGKLYVSIGDAHFALNHYQKALQNYQQALMTFLPQFDISDPEINPAEQLWSREVWLMEVFEGKGNCFFELYKNTNQDKWLYLAEENSELAVRLIHNIKMNYNHTKSKLLLGSYTHPFYERVIELKFLLFEKTQKKTYLEAAFQTAQAANAFVLRALFNEQEALVTAGVPEDTLALLKSYHQHTNNLHSLSKNQSKSVLDSLQNIRFHWQEKIDELKKVIRRQYPKFAQLRNNLELATVSALQVKLAPSQLLIKYFLGQQTLYTFSISHSKFEVYSMVLPDGFQEQIHQYRRGLSDLDFIKSSPQIAEQQFLSSAHRLFQLLLEKTLDKHLQQTDISQLVIVGDGILNAIPFQALCLSKSDSWTNHEHYVLSKYAVSYQYFCNRFLNTSSSSTAQENFVSFGLEFDDYTLQALRQQNKKEVKHKVIKETLRSGDFSKLPFSDDEAQVVAQLMGGTAWLNEVATKQTFLAQVPQANLIHLATHSMVNEENPDWSALIFTKTKNNADHILWQEEIYQLDLNADLIVLSACSTGQGLHQKGEGLQSLARAFNCAGIPSILATCWNVTDEASKRMMEPFYRLLKTGIPKDIALQKAQLEYLSNDAISSPAYRLPIYWAAWLPIGEQQPIVSKGNNALLYASAFFIVLLIIAYRLFRR